MPNNIAREVEKLADDLGVDRKRSIGEVAKELKIEPHIIRFWEEKFPQIQPEIGAGKRRYYYNKQFKILKRIKKFLYEEGYTIAGLQKLLKKRKHDDHKGEDLDIILNMNFSDEEKSLLSSQEIKLEEISEDEYSPEITEKSPINSEQNFALDDFIEPSIDADHNNISHVINPKTKMLKFADEDIIYIDQKKKKEIDGVLDDVRATLGKLKLLLKG